MNMDDLRACAKWLQGHYVQSNTTKIAEATMIAAGLHQIACTNLEVAKALNRIAATMEDEKKKREEKEGLRLA